jgi:hypothetical protein
MKALDEELRGALRRLQPPEGFADRVRQRVESEGRFARHQPTRATGAMRWALAATLVVAAGGGLWYRAEEQRRLQGEEAKRQVLLSLSIAGTKLKAIEMKVNHGEER